MRDIFTLKQDARNSAEDRATPVVVNASSTVQKKRCRFKIGYLMSLCTNAVCPFPWTSNVSRPCAFFKNCVWAKEDTSITGVYLFGDLRQICRILWTVYTIMGWDVEWQGSMQQFLSICCGCCLEWKQREEAKGGVKGGVDKNSQRVQYCLRKPFYIVSVIFSRKYFANITKSVSKSEESCLGTLALHICKSPRGYGDVVTYM